MLCSMVTQAYLATVLNARITLTASIRGYRTRRGVTINERRQILHKPQPADNGLVSGQMNKRQNIALSRDRGALGIRRGLCCMQQGRDVCIARGT